MHLEVILFVLGVAFTALAAPLNFVGIQSFDGPVKQGSYLVTLKAQISKGDHFKKFNRKFNGDGSVITHPEWTLIDGFAATLSSQALEELRKDPDVASIEQDGIISVGSTSTETSAPWGLSRLSHTAQLSDQNPNDLTFRYSYDSQAGKGVDIYVIDTGIYTAHSQFGGRATWGATFGGYANQDGNGHGTHVAGTAAGSQFGVAKAASLIAVKVLSDSGSGAVSDVISGVNYVLTRVKSTKRPSVVNMSFSGGTSTALDNAVVALTNAGIHVAVAAGNNGADASNYSPARVASVNTVGATNVGDAITSWSNYGTVLDILAPGDTITSAWIGSTTATQVLSGTSMATPHVAGLIAYFIGVEGNVNPPSMTGKIRYWAVKNAISGLPPGTTNYLARNNIAG